MEAGDVKVSEEGGGQRQTLSGRNAGNPIRSSLKDPQIPGNLLFYMLGVVAGTAALRRSEGRCGVLATVNIAHKSDRSHNYSIRTKKKTPSKKESG